MLTKQWFEQFSLQGILRTASLLPELRTVASKFSAESISVQAWGQGNIFPFSFRFTHFYLCMLHFCWEMKCWAKLLPWCWRFMIKFLTQHAFVQHLAKLASVPQHPLQKMGELAWNVHASTNTMVMRVPFPSDPWDASKSLFPAEVCLPSTYQPTSQFSVVTQSLGWGKAWVLWHSPPQQCS